eukprot:m.166837 g.166837  ORF g.166837 m.166837 type:complete len:388 (+) comp18173_c0_seq1:249-1412(+)
MDVPAKKLLIVGAGLTGSVLANILKTQLRNTKGQQLLVEVWDKASRPGGRAYTSRVGLAAQCDIGLQYLSTDPTNLHRYYPELLDAKVITEMSGKVAGNNSGYMDPSKKHFAVVNGASSLSDYFLSGSNVVYKRQVTSLNSTVATADAPSNGCWNVTASDGTEQQFDGVVLTCPVPQILSLGGDVESTIAKTPDLLEKLQKVTYSSRWCLALELASSAWETPTEGGWAARYVSKSESSSICYIAVDQRKRGIDVDSERRAGKGPVVVVHASVPWSLQHHAAVPAGEESSAAGGEDVRSAVEEMLTKEATTLVPELLQAHGIVSTKLHKWRFSQVFQGLDGGDGAVVASTLPLLVLAGDGCLPRSSFDSCVASATRAAQRVVGELAHM